MTENHICGFALTVAISGRKVLGKEKCQVNRLQHGIWSKTWPQQVRMDLASPGTVLSSKCSSNLLLFQQGCSYKLIDLAFLKRSLHWHKDAASYLYWFYATSRHPCNPNSLSHSSSSLNSSSCFLGATQSELLQGSQRYIVFKDLQYLADLGVGIQTRLFQNIMYPRQAHIVNVDRKQADAPLFTSRDNMDS